MVPNMIRMKFSDICQEAKTIVVLVVCASQGSDLRWLPHIDIGEPQFQEPYGCIWKHSEEYYYLIVFIIYLSF
jgi:hypothetical protein